MIPGETTEPEANVAKDYGPVLDREACTLRRKPPCEEHTNAPGRSTGERLSSAMTLTLIMANGFRADHQSRMAAPKVLPITARRVGIPCCFQP
jgi:hypothetical protein